MINHQIYKNIANKEIIEQYISEHLMNKKELIDFEIPIKSEENFEAIEIVCFFFRNFFYNKKK